MPDTAGGDIRLDGGFQIVVRCPGGETTAPLVQCARTSRQWQMQLGRVLDKVLPRVRGCPIFDVKCGTQCRKTRSMRHWSQAGMHVRLQLLHRCSDNVLAPL